MLYVRLPVRWFIVCMLLETCRIFFSEIDMLDGRRRQGRCWGNALQILFVQQMVRFIRPILYKDTVIKIHKFLFSGIKVKYLDHEERAWIVCMTQYMRFGLIAFLQNPLIAFLQNPLIIVYFGVSWGTRCLKVVWSLLQHSYFVYGKCKNSAKAMRNPRLVGAFATRRCKKNYHLVC